MTIYILVSTAGHYMSAHKTRKDAEQAALNNEMHGWKILVDTL
jgi:hypothetical protein